MENELVAYISKCVFLSEETKGIIRESSVIRRFPKGTVLLKQGAVSNESYFVLKGCIVSYLLQDGDEKTLEFYTEEQPAVPLSYGTKMPSAHYLQCVEDTVANVSTPEHERAMFQKYPQFEAICRVVAEATMAHHQEALLHYKTTSPEDRYVALLKNRPGLVQRVPQYQLASYLGVRPESLSRIRRRLASR